MSSVKNLTALKLLGKHEISKDKIIIFRNPEVEGDALLQFENRLQNFQTSLIPEFNALVEEQYELVMKYCEEIAGKKSEKGINPDPVRLLEMAQQLFLSEYNYLAQLLKNNN